MGQERRASISVRLAPKSSKGHGGQIAHDLRRSADLGYVDYQRSPRNSILMKPAAANELKQICEERRSKRQTRRAMKSNTRIAFEGIITFSKLAQPIIEALPLSRQDDIFQQVADQIARHLNTTLHGLVVHRDESAIHAHFTLAGYDLNGNPLTQTVKRQQCVQIQDIAAEVVQDLGISRGKSKIERIKDGEPLEAYINRSVRQLHNDLPKEIAELEKRIEELAEKEHKTAKRLEKTQAKLEQAQGENERLQKRLETYQRRLEATRSELKQAQAEIERLRKLVEPQKPKPIQIRYLSGWEESGWGPFKRKNPVLKPAKVINPSDAEKALIATRKAAEEEAKRKAEEAVQDELHRLRQLQDVLSAIEQAAEIGRLPSVESSPTAAPYSERKTPPEILHYNATLLDYGERLVAAGDGTSIQQAAALYKEAHERWSSALFWGMNEAQIEWLVKAAEKDGYSIEFAEPWAQKHAAEIRRQLMTQQNEPAAGRSFDL